MEIHKNTPTSTMHSLLRAQKSHLVKKGIPSMATRKDRLRRLILMLVNNRRKIADSLSEDFDGRSPHTSLLYDILAVCHGIEHTVMHLDDWSKNTVVTAPIEDATAEVIYQPKGVVGIVSPWNFPYQLTFGPLTGAFAAGNSAMIKPSELTPQTGQLMHELVCENFSPEELSVVLGDVEVAAEFTRLPFDHLIFTGSTSVGVKVLRATADNLTPSTLELGGKSPVVIADDADIFSSARSIIAAKTVNAGQICVAPDHVYVPRFKITEFVHAAFAAATSMFPAGDETDYTAIINEKHYKRLQGLLEDACDKGARVMSLGMSRIDKNTSQYMPPTLILEPTDDMKVMREEIFGPLLPVIPYDDLSSVIRAVRKAPAPLAIYFFGNKTDDHTRILENTVSGGVTFNDCMAHVTVAGLPFGGIGPSGMGAYHGIWGFRTFSHARAVYKLPENAAAQSFPPPPFSKKFDLKIQSAFSEIFANNSVGR